MSSEETILSMLARIMERLDALESIRADQVIVEDGSITIMTAEHAPILVAHADDVTVKARRAVSIHVGGDVHGEIRTREGKFDIEAKGDIHGGVWAPSEDVAVKTKKGATKFDMSPPPTPLDDAA